MFKITVGEGSMMSESESEDESGSESSNESKCLELESCINQEPLKAELQVKTVDVMIADFNNTSISTYSSSPNSKSNPNPHNFASQETDFEFLKAIENHENRTPIIEETEKINLSNNSDSKLVQIGLTLSQAERDDLIKLLSEYVDVFAWSYHDMPGVDPSIGQHTIPLIPGSKPIMQKLRRMKPDVSLKIQEEVSKQLEAGFIREAKYPEWIANVVPVPKKDGKVRMCVDYRDLNRASPKDGFPLPHIDILVDNTANHALLSFMDGYAGYNQIPMAEEDMEKTTFITQWGTYCYTVMPFGLKNAGATYQRTATAIMSDMIHREIEVYVDDMIVKSKERHEHTSVLRKFFNRLRQYNMRLNPQKCAFGVTSGKLLGYVISSRGIEADPSKIKAILEMQPPMNEKEIRGFLGRLQYISRFISRLTMICEPVFRKLRKSEPKVWDDDCQHAFETIKSYLSNPPVLKPAMPGIPLRLYLTTTDSAVGAMLAQEIEGKENAVYYISKKLIEYETKYTQLEKLSIALVWATKKLRHYMLSHTIHVISKADPLKYLFEKPALNGRLSRWLVMLAEFDLKYIPQKSIKGSAV